MATAKKDRSGRVLERVARRECIDDTIPLSVTIQTYKILQSHVEYTIRVQRGSNPDDSWTVDHRYSDFVALNQALQISGIHADLPPKKVFNSKDRQFLNDRQQGLQEYLDKVVKDPYISASLKLKTFLDPTHYSEGKHEIALRSVSMFFRSNPEWQIIKPLIDIGWRINKHYFLIGSKVNPSLSKRVLTWIEPGPDFFVPEHEFDNLLKVLTDLRHPNIISPLTATYNEGSGLFITRDFYERGSLRDIMHKAPSGRHYLKACHPGEPLESAKIRKYGYQILDTMQYLLNKGFVLGQLSSGNIIIDGSICKLIDLENCLMGLPSFHRTFILDLRKIHGAEAEAVYAFGHLLYEMTYGRPLKTCTVDEFPSDVFVGDHLSSLLHSLLSSAGVKALPTIKELISNPFFAGEIPNSEKPFLKVPSRLKEVVRSLGERVDARLLEDQRKVSQFRRMSRAQESLMSDEEKKKRQKKIRRQMTEEATQKDTEAYPTSKLRKQLTVPSSQAPSVKHKDSVSPKVETSSKKTSASNGTVLPPPPTTKAPEPQAAPPPPKTGERGALLSSIEGFAKGKLKKTVTNDRSGPFI